MSTLAVAAGVGQDASPSSVQPVNLPGPSRPGLLAPDLTPKVPPHGALGGREAAFLASLRNSPQDSLSCPSPVVIFVDDPARKVKIGCGRRRCPACGPKRWKPRALAGLHSGLKGPEVEYLALLLTAPGDADPDAFNAEAASHWNHFVTLLRREYPGATLDFWKVGELQQRGHVHFHIVLRGLRFLPAATLRRLALAAGFGSFVGVKRPRDYPGGARSLGFYFGKYLLKDYARLGRYARIVTYSYRWRLTWTTYDKRSRGLEVVMATGLPWSAIARMHGFDPVREDPPPKPPDPAWWHRSETAVKRAETRPERGLFHG